MKHWHVRYIRNTCMPSTAFASAVKPSKHHGTTSQRSLEELVIVIFNSTTSQRSLEELLTLTTLLLKDLSRNHSSLTTLLLQDLSKLLISNKTTTSQRTLEELLISNKTTTSQRSLEELLISITTSQRSLEDLLVSITTLLLKDLSRNYASLTTL